MCLVIYRTPFCHRCPTWQRKKNRHTHQYVHLISITYFVNDRFNKFHAYSRYSSEGSHTQTYNYPYPHTRTGSYTHPVSHTHKRTGSYTHPESLSHTNTYSLLYTPGVSHTHAQTSSNNPQMNGDGSEAARACHDNAPGCPAEP